MKISDERRRLRIERMGRVAYGRMLALQEQRHDDVRHGREDDTFFLLEHEPVVTLGRNSGDGHLLVSREHLAARGVELFETGRGGDVTFHGPGQIVGYPILALQEGEQDVRGYVWRLEEIMIRTARDFGVEAERVEGLRGIWVGNDKIGAVGVRIAWWTTMHGFAFNVRDRLDGFSLIVPCGLHGKGVTCLERAAGQSLELDAVHDRLAHHAADVLERQTVAVEASHLPRPRRRRNDAASQEAQP